MEKREILFRAWDGREMIHDIAVGRHSKDAEEANNTVLQIDDGDHWIVEEPFVAIMQYTGLKDQEGKRIYEGDVVKITLPKPKGWERIGVVEFSRQYLMWVVSIPDTMGCYGLRAVSESILAIGSQLDSPELLKKHQDDR